jgi:hypothetical protein
VCYKHTLDKECKTDGCINTGRYDYCSACYIKTQRGLPCEKQKKVWAAADCVNYSLYNECKRDTCHEKTKYDFCNNCKNNQDVNECIGYNCKAKCSRRYCSECFEVLKRYTS